MKKVLFMMLAACSMMLVGCNKENSQQQEPDQQGQTPEAKPVAAGLEYTFEVNDTMLLVADFKVSYYDQDGKVQTETLNSTKWSKTVQAKLPAKLGVKVDAAMKPYYDPAKFNKVFILREYSVYTYRLDENGKVIGEKEKSGISSGVSVPGDKVTDALSKDGGFLSVLRSYDAEGKETQLDWNE